MSSRWLAFIVGVRLPRQLGEAYHAADRPAGRVDFNNFYRPLGGPSLKAAQERRGDGQLRRVHQHGDHVRSSFVVFHRARCAEGRTT
jgi:hypothetical protein